MLHREKFYSLCNTKKYEKFFINGNVLKCKHLCMWWISSQWDMTRVWGSGRKLSLANKNSCIPDLLSTHTTWPKIWCSFRYYIKINDDVLDVSPDENRGVLCLLRWLQRLRETHDSYTIKQKWETIEIWFFLHSSYCNLCEKLFSSFIRSSLYADASNSDDQAI